MLLRENQKFVRKLEDLFFKATGGWNFSPEELYAYSYGFGRIKPIIKKSTEIETMSINDIVHCSFKSDNNAFLVLEEKGWFRKSPIENSNYYISANQTKFHFSNLLSNIHRRITFFSGKVHEGKFFIDKIMIYVPSADETSVYLGTDFYNDIIEFIKQPEKKILEIFQDLPLSSKSEEEVVPDPCKDFFIITDLKIKGNNVIIHYDHTSNV